MAVKLITPQDGTAVDLAIAKQHLRVDHDDDDDLIEAMLKAAEQHAAGFTGRVFVDSTFDLLLDGFPADVIKIPNPPLIEVIGVFYDDGAGGEIEMPASGYVIDRSIDPPQLVLSSGAGDWPTTTGAARVRFRAGYIDNVPDPPIGEVPQDIQIGILLILSTMYENRQNMIVGQSVAMMPWGSEQLLRPHRIHTAIG